MMDEGMSENQFNVDEPRPATAATVAGIDHETEDAGPRPQPLLPATCSVIIPVHNKASLTRQCLDTMLTQTEPVIKREIIVVDDGSSDATPRLLASYGDRITVITNAPGRGFAGACNAGAAAAAGEYLIFLNNDTVPEDGWLAALAAYAQAHPAAGIIGAKLLYPDDSIQHAGVAIGYDRYPRHIYVGFPSTHPAVNKSRQFQAVTAACLLIRRTLWEELGGFDTGYRNGWEDVDLCLRARVAGAEVHYCHESVIYHLESVSRDVRAPDERANRERYEARWKETIVPDDLQYYIEDDLMSFSYQARYPIRMTVSPRLITWADSDSFRESDRLLAERARQVTILLKNNIVLNIRVHEAELRALEAERRLRDAQQRLREAGLEPATGTNGAASPAPKSMPANIIGSVEQPGVQPAPVTGPTLPVSGWAHSPFGIASVDAYFDGELAGALTYGLPRPDVAAVHPGYPDAEQGGFAGEISLAGLAAGEHVLMVRIHDKHHRFADATTRFQIEPPAHDGSVAACDRPAAAPEQRDRD
jgi:GT2 family glycosyltransferase